MLNALKSRLDSHFVACSAVAAAATVGGFTQESEADIIHSGAVNINIPTTTSGVYLNFVTGVSNPDDALVPGWDVNPWSSTGFGLFNPGGFATYVTTTAGGTTAVNMTPGAIIDATSNFGSNSSANTSQWVMNSDQNLVGIRFQNEDTGQIHYGWMRISFSSSPTAQPRAIVEYAYESEPGVGIGAGVVPAPGSLALLALGAAGLAGRRRK